MPFNRPLLKGTNVIVALKALTNDILMKNTLTTLKLNLTSKKKAFASFPQNHRRRSATPTIKFPARSSGSCCRGVGDSVVLDVTPDQREFGRMAAMQTKQVLAQKRAAPNDSRGVPRPGRNCLQARYCGLKGNQCSWQSAVALVSQVKPSTSRNSCPTITIEQNATFKVYLKVCQGQQRGPQLVVSRADAGLVVYLFANEVPEMRMRSSGLLQWRKPIHPLVLLVPY